MTFEDLTLFHNFEFSLKTLTYNTLNLVKPPRLDPKTHIRLNNNRI